MKNLLCCGYSGSKNTKNTAPPTRPATAAIPICLHPPAPKCNSSPSTTDAPVSRLGMRRLRTSDIAPAEAHSDASSRYMQSGESFMPGHQGIESANDSVVRMLAKQFSELAASARCQNTTRRSTLAVPRGLDRHVALPFSGREGRTILEAMLSRLWDGNYAALDRVLPTLLKALPMSLASVFIPINAPRAINAATNAYSIRS